MSAYDSRWMDWIIYGGEMPALHEGAPKVPFPDGYILVVDKKTGCHFQGKDLIHTDECMCGDYPESTNETKETTWEQ